MFRKTETCDPREGDSCLINDINGSVGDDVFLIITSDL